MFEYSADLEKEQIIGTITNTYYFYLGGRGGGRYFWPYNLIFTTNSFFGEHLWGDQKDTLGYPDTSQLKGYMSKGQVLMDNSVVLDKSSKIDLKFSYDKIKQINLSQQKPESFSIPPITLPDSAAYLKLNTGFLNLSQFNFMYTQELLAKVKNLLGKTALSEKIVTK